MVLDMERETSWHLWPHLLVCQMPHMNTWPHIHPCFVFVWTKAGSISLILTCIGLVNPSPVTEELNCSTTTIWSTMQMKTADMAPFSFLMDFWNDSSLPPPLSVLFFMLFCLLSPYLPTPPYPSYMKAFTVIKCRASHSAAQLQRRLLIRPAGRTQRQLAAFAPSPMTFCKWGEINLTKFIISGH